MFFEYCVKCDRIFQSETAWNQHLAEHKKPKAVGKPFEEIEKQRILEAAAAVPGADKTEFEDARVAKTVELRSMKKALKKAGIDCQTMTAAEAKAAYEQAKEEGKIKE